MESRDAKTKAWDADTESRDAIAKRSHANAKSRRANTKSKRAIAIARFAHRVKAEQIAISFHKTLCSFVPKLQLRHALVGEAPLRAACAR